MFARETLWQRRCGAGWWPLAWALAAACAVPWLLPERWDGRSPCWVPALGWLGVLVSGPLAGSRRWAALALALALAWGTVGALGRLARWEARLPSGFQRVEGVLDAPWDCTAGGRACRVRVEAPEALRGLRLPLRLPPAGAPGPAPGTPVRFLAELCPVRPQPAFLPERKRWRALAARRPLEARLGSALALEALGPPRPDPLLRLAVWARERFEALGLRGPARDLWGAFTLAIPPVRPDSLEAFAESGTLHVLVVSGLQVTLVMGALAGLCRPLGPAGGMLAAWTGGLFYCAVAGFTAPVWRGLAMGCAWTAGRASGWQLPRALTLHAALLAWHLVHPGAGADPGFLLAWLALTGLAGAAEPLAGLFSLLPRMTARPLARVLAPWLATFPLLALLNGGVPLWGAAASFLLLPLVAVLVPLCLGLTLVPVGPLVAAVAGLLSWCGGTLAPAFARIVPLGTGILWPWLALASGWILLAQRHAGFRRTRALCALLTGASGLLLALRGTGRAPRTLSVEAIDVGQGDALLVRAPGGAATLVDSGPDAGAARRIARVLSRRGVREPLRLLLTHPHQDHAGGWATLVRLWPPAGTGLPALAGGAAAWRAYAPPGAGGPGPRSLLRGDAWAEGEASFSVRWPPAPLRMADPNMASLVLRLRWGDRECWLMGDALAVQERDLLALGDPGPAGPARLLKAGHHGSRSASDLAWADALAPDLALVCAGRDNRFEHPHPEAMAALRGAGARVYVTGRRQGLRVLAAGREWVVEAGDGTCFRFPATRGEGAPEGLFKNIK